MKWETIIQKLNGYFYIGFKLSRQDEPTLCSKIQKNWDKGLFQMQRTFSNPPKKPSTKKDLFITYTVIFESQIYKLDSPRRFYSSSKLKEHKAP